MRSRLSVVFVALGLLPVGQVRHAEPSAPHRPADTTQAPESAFQVASAPTPPATDSGVSTGLTAADTATRVAVTVQVAEPPPTLPAVAATPGWARCGEWWDTARAVGWPEGQLATVDYVMHRESRCNPGATGVRVGCCRALGLMQLLGWNCPPDGCYDPTSNLAKALELWQRSGWRPWCLAGDRVTGGC